MDHAREIPPVQLAREQDAQRLMSVMMREGVLGTKREEDVFQQDDLLLFQQDEEWDEWGEDDEDVEALGAGAAARRGDGSGGAGAAGPAHPAQQQMPAPGLADAIAQLAHVVTHVWGALLPCRDVDAQQQRLRSLGHLLATHTGLDVRLRTGVVPPPVTAEAALVGGCKSPAAAAATRARQAAVGSQLSHSFLLIDLTQPHASDDHGPEQRSSSTVLIVDPLFREQLSLGLADAEYARLLDTAVPEVFVGTAGQMGTMLSAACDGVAAAYARAGVPVPVWRGARAITSKWLPVVFTDEALGPRSSSGRGSAARGTSAAAQPAAPQPQRQAAPPPSPAAGLHTRSRGIDGSAPAEPKHVVVGFSLAGSSGAPAAAAGATRGGDGAAPRAVAHVRVPSFATFAPTHRSGTSTSLSSSVTSTFTAATLSNGMAYLRSLSIVQ
ncbi:hypothetical protein FOA52_008835 [Chlamydomonas sp. UWO 241]|nr:hypothetical protein FOA52_008835 [Chlamydomonas sp. UWO 241]